MNALHRLPAIVECQTSFIAATVSSNQFRSLGFMKLDWVAGCADQ
jgi:hypothetical protein